MGYIRTIGATIENYQCQHCCQGSAEALTRRAAGPSNPRISKPFIDLTCEKARDNGVSPVMVADQDDSQPYLSRFGASRIPVRNLGVMSRENLGWRACSVVTVNIS